jgi:hypothetical protein
MALMSTVSTSLSDEIDVWRLVTEKIATLQELETVWSYDDMVRAIVALDIRSEIDNIYSEVTLK